jgi:putative peptidoglycan lipid II flippase
MSFARSILTAGGFTMLSRIAGFVRDTLMARILGAGLEADAFFVAFRLPNLFRSLFAEGSFTAAFLPLFTRELKTQGHDSARALAEESLAMLLAVLIPLSAVAALAMPALVALLASGFTERPDQFALAVELSRLTFPYLLLISLTALLGSMLNALGHFGPFAAAPVLLNLVQISGLLLAHRFGLSPALTLSYGVPVAGAVQMLWMAAALRRAGMPLGLPWPRLTAGVRQLWRLLIPGIVGAGVYQINLLIGTNLASYLPAGSVSYLNYADRLNQLPMGVVGIAIGTALLPVLSRSVVAGDHAQVRHYMSRGLQVAMVLGLPAAVALMTIPRTIIEVIFQGGRFDAAGATATAAALSAYAIGIPATVVARVFSSAYFARQDTSGPVRVAIVVMAANLVLSLALIGPLAHVGLALAPGLTAWLNVGLLAWGLRRQGNLDLDPRLVRYGLRVTLACLMMAATLYGGALLLAPWLGDHRLAIQGAALALLIGAGGLVYFAALALLRVARPSDLKAMRRAS